MIVTDVLWTNKGGETKRGFYMDGYLAENLAGAPNHMKKDWDVVGIVTGSAKVRVGKSSIAMQSGYFVAWLLAGGVMDFDRSSPTYGKILKSPDKQVRFSLKENVVFCVEDLMKKGHELPKNSVIIYDEGKEGLDAKSTMSNINKTLDTFFQECGVYNHFILIVLPDFFQLSKSFSTSRSNFLINTYINDKYERGFFSFYNERQKEKLCLFGGRLIGSFAKYSAAYPNFRGKFTKWLPFDKDEYDSMKKDALNKKRLSRNDARIAQQRDVLIYLYQKLADLNSKELSDEINDKFGIRIGRVVIRTATQNAIKLEENKLYLEKTLN